MNGIGGESQTPLLLVPPTPFIGREMELSELAGLLKSNRLLTMIGPGGSGKTRLAMELIRRSTPSDEIVTVVALDGVSDQAVVVTAVCAALGLRDAPDLAQDEQLDQYLGAHPQLLVLDNCEHLIGAVRNLVHRAMIASPELRVLATSRMLLGVEGEQVWVVPPMELPAVGAMPADVDRSDAGRLFVERARSRQADFTLNPANAAAVVRICELVDGLPLALELAAGWSAVLSTTELAKRLGEGLALLDADGSGPGRHRTLRATAEWSDALLTPQDRALLARLSVFVGRFTVDDAEQVASTDGQDVVFALRRLVDSSWVVAVHGDETTYGLLNTLRTYGRELLDRTGEADLVRGRHAAVIATLAEASESGLAGPEQTRWRARMELATGDVEAALEWARRTGDATLGLRLVASLWRWWYTTGRIVEGRRWTAVALSHARQAPGVLRARALYTSAMLASENGDYATAASHAQSARRGFEAIGDHAGAARSNTVLGNVAKFRDDIPAATRHLSDAVSSQRALGNDWATAVALQNLAALMIDQGDLHAGRALTEESLALKRLAGDRRSVGYGLINLSDLLVREHNPDRARLVLDEAASIAVDLGDGRLAAFVDHNLGDVAVDAGEVDQAAVHYRRALAGFRIVRDRRDEALTLCSLGRALVRLAETNEGLSLLRQSESLANEIGDELRLSEARAALAESAAPPSVRSLPGGLTARQAEVLGLVAAGLSNREIGVHLTLSAGTVERHLANVYAKIGVTNRVGAARYALSHGLGGSAPH